MSLRSAFYDRGLLPTHRVDGLAVVSVGNIRVGGSGKTPLAIYTATRLKEHGRRTGVLLRGYKGNLEHKGGLVSSGGGPLVGPAEAGDEAYLVAIRTEDIYVWVGADREAGARLLRDRGVEVVVLDDGFQRRRLHRDLDIVLVSPEDIASDTRLLPSGPLRESKEALHRAHILGGFVSDWSGIDDPPPLLFSYNPTGFISAKSDEFHPLADFEGEAAYLVSGIAKPDRFQDTAKQTCLTIVGSSEFRDHHKFTDRDLETVTKNARDLGADLLVTTEKDLTRMIHLDCEIPTFALRIDVDIRTGVSLLKEHLSRILNL